MASQEPLVGESTSATMLDDPAEAPVKQAHRTVCAARNSRRHPAGGHYRGRSLTVHSRRHPDRSRYSTGGKAVSPQARTRSVLICVVITVAVGLLFLAVSDLFGWDTNRELVWFGLSLVLFAGAVCLNAITVGSLREGRGATPPG